MSVGAYRRAEREQDRLTKATETAARRQSEAMSSVGRGAMVFGAVVAAGLGMAAKAAIDWESAWAGVEKTVDGTPEQMNQLEASLRNLATTLPATHEEIAGVAEAAGQLGIARGDIIEFTKVAVAMGASTNLSAEEAATGMARLGNIMGTASSDVDRMGSALVAVGNAGASTEGEVLDMSLRIAAAGRQAGMSEGDVMGLANAMSSLGIESEAGGTAISTVIKTIGTAVSNGGEELEAYARIAGTTSEQFATAWRDDAAGALTTFVGGLARMQAEGQNVNTVINDLGLGGIRTSDTLLRLSGDTDGLADSLALGNSAWAENTALMDEANKRYETTASQIQMARNQITDAAIDIGGALLPALAKGADVIADLARGFQELPGGLQDAIVVLGTLAATVGLVGGSAMVALPKIAALRATMATLETTGGKASTAVGKFGLFMTGPWGAALGAATVGLTALVAWLGNSSRASEDAAGGQTNLARALRETKGAIDDTVRAGVLADLDELGLTDWATNNGIALEDMINASLGVPEAMDRVVAAAELARDAFTLADVPDTVGNGSRADRLAYLGQVQSSYDAMIGKLQTLAGVTSSSTAEQETQAAAIEASGAAAAGGISSMDSLTTATEGVGEAGEKAATAAEKLADAIDALNGPTLNLRDTTRAFEEQLDEMAAAMGEEGWKKTLDNTTEAGRANQQMLDDLAKSAMDQANAIAANGGSYDAFRGSLEFSRQALVDSAIAMGATEEQAWALANQILQIPDAAMVDVAIPTYGQVTQQLIDVHSKIQGIPPNTTTNVGVLSAEAIAKLEAVGFKAVTLPDGTVDVTALTAQAERDLNNLARPREAVIKTYIQEIRERGGGMSDGPRAAGGPVWAGGTFLVGEKGPELVRFGQSGWVTPADQTAQILGALRQPAPDAPALAMATAGAAAGRTSNVSHSRTYAPHVTVTNARPMDERRLATFLADEEFLHG